MVAGVGVEPTVEHYERSVLPLHYPATGTLLYSLLRSDPVTAGTHQLTLSDL